MVRLSWNTRPPGTPPPSDPVTVFTRIKGRTPEWKAHTSLRAAKGALAYRRPSYWRDRGYVPELWTWDGEKWSLAD